MGLFDFLFKEAEDKVQKKFNYLTEKAYNKAIKDDDISQLDDNEKVFFVLYIFNLEIQNGGLCAYNTGTISNSTSSATVSNSKYVGGLVGYTYGGTIKTSSSTGSVSNGLTESYMGGLIGYADASVNILKITDSSSTATVCYEYLEDSTMVTSYAGGLIGYATSGELTEINGYVDNSHYNGEITVNIDSSQTDSAITLTSYVGGLVGSSSYIKYNRCFTSGKLNNIVLKDNFVEDYRRIVGDGYSKYSKGDYYHWYNYAKSYIGGLIGSDQSGEYDYAYSNTEIVNNTYLINYYRDNYDYGNWSDLSSYVHFAYAYSYIGGLIGESNLSIISDAYSSSNIISMTSSQANYTSNHYVNEAETYSYVGGLLGNTNSLNPTITNSYASNESFVVTAEVDAYNSGYYTIVNNYGGLVGTENVTLDNCYRYSGTDSNIELGTPTSLANLKSVNFITNTLGWDTEIWLLENGKYPTLK